MRLAILAGIMGRNVTVVYFFQDGRFNMTNHLDRLDMIDHLDRLNIIDHFVKLAMIVLTDST